MNFFREGVDFPKKFGIMTVIRFRSLMRPDGQEGLTMDHTCRAVFILEEDHSIPAGHKPLMLEAILHRPIMERAVVQCLADGVQRFFVVCSPRFAEEAAACFPEGTDVVISEQHAELLDFLDNDEDTLVLCRAALPMAQAGPGFAYSAPGRELREVWKNKMTNAVSGASLVSGWLPIFGPETIAELEPVLAKMEQES